MLCGWTRRRWLEALGATRPPTVASLRGAVSAVHRWLLHDAVICGVGGRTHAGGRRVTVAALHALRSLVAQLPPLPAALAAAAAAKKAKMQKQKQSRRLRRLQHQRRGGDGGGGGGVVAVGAASIGGGGGGGGGREMMALDDDMDGGGGAGGIDAEEVEEAEARWINAEESSRTVAVGPIVYMHTSHTYSVGLAGLNEIKKTRVLRVFFFFYRW